jgi:CheY-specific phosphatase CheX
MSERKYDELVSGAVEAVLETMFFSAPLGPAEPEIGNSAVAARLAFHGNPSGRLDVHLSEPSAQPLAAGFLGEEEETLTASQPGQVVCELANMLCGSLVSKLESEASFDLTSPELVPVGSEAAAGSEDSPATSQSFELENGILTVTLHLRTAA